MLYNEDGTFSHYIISKRSIWSGLQAAGAKISLFYEGYIYTPQKPLANDVESYECERRRHDCKCKVKILGNRVVSQLHDLAEVKYLK